MKQKTKLFGPKCCIRSLHITLSLSVPVTLVFLNSDLHKHLWAHSSIQDVVYFTVYGSLLALSLLFYCLTFCTDPGFVPFDSVTSSQVDVENGHVDSDVCQMEEDDDQEVDAEVTLLSSDGIKLRHCKECNIKQPMRSHHCEDCKRCVRKFDHHCPWFETCIGEGNHHYFLVFILLKTPLVLWSTVLAWRGIESDLDWVDWIKSNIIYVMDLCVLFPASFTLICLLCMHSYFAVTNTTTWEMMARERITYLKNIDFDRNPFHQGYCKNIYHFLCWKSVVRWEVLYQKFSKRSTVI